MSSSLCTLNSFPQPSFTYLLIGPGDALQIGKQGVLGSNPTEVRLIVCEKKYWIQLLNSFKQTIVGFEFNVWAKMTIFDIKIGKIEV